MFMRKFYILFLTLVIGLISDAQPNHWNALPTGNANVFPFNTLPATGKKVQWLVGGSYVYTMNTNLHGVGVDFGLSLFDRHNILLGATTLNQVSARYVYKIKTFKRKK